MYEYSTEGLVADAVPVSGAFVAPCGLRGGRAWDLTSDLQTLPRVVGGSSWVMDVRRTKAERSTFSFRTWKVAPYASLYSCTQCTHATDGWVVALTCSRAGERCGAYD